MLSTALLSQELARPFHRQPAFADVPQDAREPNEAELERRADAKEEYIESRKAYDVEENEKQRVNFPFFDDYPPLWDMKPLKGPYSSTGDIPMYTL